MVCSRKCEIPGMSVEAQVSDWRETQVSYKEGLLFPMKTDLKREFCVTPWFGMR